MTDIIDLESLANELADIARTTTDATAGQRLMALAHHLLTRAGLPPENGCGGDLPPSGWISEPVCTLAE